MQKYDLIEVIRSSFCMIWPDSCTLLLVAFIICSLHMQYVVLILTAIISAVIIFPWDRPCTTVQAHNILAILL